MVTIRKRKLKDGSVTYHVQIRLRGYPSQTESFTQLTHAKRWANQTETAIIEGRHFKTTEAKKHTLADLIDRYIKNTLPTKPKSIPQQKAQLLWWREEIGTYLLSDISPNFISRMSG